MANSYRNWTPDQIALLPTDPREWLACDHLAYQVLDAVGMLDVSDFGSKSKDTRGAPGFDPKMMVSVFLYALCKNVVSSRNIAQLCLDDLGARFLVAGSPPKYRALADFRKEHDETLGGLLAKTVVLCEQAGLVDVSDCFLDGAKFRANASLRKNVPYENIDKKLAKIEERIAALFSEADQADAEEDTLFGPDDDGCGRGNGSGKSDKLTGDQAREHDLMVRRREQLLKAKERIEGDAKREYEDHLSRPSSERTHHTAPTGSPKPKDRANLTDVESSIMTTWEKGYVQGYNGQIVVEKSHHIIVGAFLSNEANDYNQLVPSFEAVKDTTGEYPNRIIADAGYFSASNIAKAQEANVPVLIPPKKIDQREVVKLKDPLTEQQLLNLKPAARMKAILATQQGHDAYSRRMCTVEPAFAMLKGCPGDIGFRQFLRRGLENCRKDWLFVCAVHNLKRYFACRKLIGAS